MAFDNLGNSLKAAFNKLVMSVTVDKKIIEEVIVDIRRSLLQSDVNVQLANDLTDKIRKRSFEEKASSGTTKREQVLKIIYEELVNFLGKKFEPLNLSKHPSTVLMAGLLGSGKTTSVAKLSRYLQKQGKKIGIICADVYRPAGLEQLQQLGQQINIPVYGEKNEKDPVKIINNGLKEFSKKDVIIVDTAGRHKQEEKLMQEIKQIGEILKPDETILVIDGTIGQAAKTQAEAFHNVLPIGSIMITKLDGTSKGGGSLSACAVTGAKIKFIGTGEKLENLELYNPERFVSRLLGLGDLETLLEKAKEANIKKESVERIAEGKFTLQDFMEQIESLGKMGPLQQIVGMIPGLGMMKISDDMLKKQEGKMKSYKVIIQSMTKQERENPDIVSAIRIKRIVKGSGKTENEVRELLNQYNQTKKMVKSLGGLKGLQRGEFKKLTQQFGFKV